VQRFGAAREAKEFLIGKIVEEARKAGVALSDVERKGLYFSEAAWTLPEISDVDAAFDRDYDGAQYETKIVKLVRQIRARERRDKSRTALCNEAVAKLRDGDHYLLVMIEDAGAVERPHGDRLKLVGSALAICAIALAAVYWLASR
jgi:predicted dithiol-disulfide oxidoreductase (DUF899 family)